MKMRGGNVEDKDLIEYPGKPGTRYAPYSRSRWELRFRKIRRYTQVATLNPHRFAGHALKDAAWVKPYPRGN